MAAIAPGEAPVVPTARRRIAASLGDNDIVHGAFVMRPHVQRITHVDDDDDDDEDDGDAWR